MLIDLNTYIKVDSLRREIEKSCVMIHNIEEAEEFTYAVMRGEIKNAIFEKSSLKNYCFSKLSEMIDVNIVNCNSTSDKFCENLDESAMVTIFDNVNQCKNLDILKIILNKKGMLVC